MRSGLYRTILLGIGEMAALLVTSPLRANTPLFVTQDDWSVGNGWSGQNGSTIATSNLFDSDLSSVNGGGNFAAPGGAGTAGSLQVNFGGSGYGAVAEISTEYTNASFISAFDPGATGDNTAVPNSGVVQLEYTQPPTPSGGYFQIGIFLQYSGDGYYGPFLSNSQVPAADGVNNTGETQWLATIPYSIVGNTWNGLGFGVFVNTNAPAGTFYVDNLQVLPGSAATFSDVNANWVTNGSGTWETATNWSSNPQIPGGSPDNIGAQITFDNNGGSISANPTITLSQAATATYLVFGNTNGGPTPNYTINSGSPAATITINSEIDSDSGTHSVNVPVITSATGFYFDVLAGSNLTISNFADTNNGGNLTKFDTGTLNIGAQNLNLTLTVDGTVNFIDGKSGGFLYGLTANSDGVVNLGKNTWNTNTITSDSQALGVINIPTGGTLYTAEYLSNSAPSTMFYNGLFTGGGSVVIGEGNTSTDTGQVIYGNSAVFYGNNTGFSGTVTVGSSFPAGTTFMTSPAVFTLEVGSASNLGDGSATNQLILDGGILQAIGSFTGTQNVMLTAKGGTIDTDGPAGGSGAIIPGGCAISLGAVSSTANGTLTKINPGQLTVAKMAGISLVVNSGIVQLAPNGTIAGASSLNALTLATSSGVPQGSLDITNNIVNIAAPSGSDPITSIVGYLLTGYDAGKWDGAGIQSSSVITQAGTGIGYADGNTDPGTAAPAGIIVVRDTWIGDLDLDGSITSADLDTLVANFGHSGAGVDWAHGDLNYDGTVNSDDVSLFMLGSADYTAGGSHPVPEPAAVGLLAMGAAGLMHRRRR